MRTIAEPSWDFPRGTSGIRALCDVAAERGVDTGDVLDGSGVTPADLTDAETVVEGAQEMGAVRNLVRLAGDRPGLGVATGGRLTVGMLGVWGFAMLLSPTVGELLDVALRHGHGKLSWIFMRPTLVRSRGSARLELDGSELIPAVRSFVVERDLMSTATAIRGIVGRDLPLVIETTLPVERREILLGALPPVITVHGGDRDAFLFDARLLACPLPMADPLTAGAVERQCVDLAARRAHHAGLAGRIRSALLRSPDDVPTLDGIAAERHVDPRTLRRQLSLEGTSFRALREEVRHRLALDLLTTTDLTVAQVSTRLGYSDPASFGRAFRRWTGRSPGSARDAKATRVSRGISNHASMGKPDRT